MDGPAVALPGFSDYELLHSGKRQVFRCTQQLPNGTRLVVLKIHPEQAFGDPAKDTLFSREFEITNALADIPGVIAVHEIYTHEKTRALVLEDFGAESLSNYITRIRYDPGRDTFFPLTERLSMCIRLADTLDAIHHHDVLHLDLKPSNILLNSETGTLKISDFGSAVRGVSTHTSRLIGTPIYASPEQTGRTTVSIDRRSDLYSLGVVFYEIFTFRLPFDCLTPAEFVQAHIAKAPIPPRTVVPTLPHILQKIVLKLLCKDKERRYSSAYGVKMDLQTVAEALNGSARSTDFDLGAHDRSGQLRAPRRLWGRDEPTQKLRDTFEAVRAGARRLAMIDGVSGVGKSALIDEFRRQLKDSNTRVLFATGKADFVVRVPYGALGQAVGELLLNVHMQGPKQAAIIKDVLVGVLGSDIDIVTSVLPATQVFFGVPQTEALTELSQIETAENAHVRFTRAMCVLMRHFATLEQPLVLYLDDLQWCDEATLRVMDALVTEKRIQHMLIVGAYRANELPGLLKSYMGEIESFKKATRLHLEGLSAGTVAELIVDVTGGQMGDARELGELCHRRTDGNPLHVMEIMRYLHAQEIFHFDPLTRAFSWDMSSIHSQIDNSEDVADLVVQRIKFLPPNVVKVVSVGACLGAIFSSVLLRRVLGCTVNEARLALSAARDASVLERHEGIINLSIEHSDPTAPPTMGEDGEPIIEEYFRFLHDKIHEAALRLIPDEQAAIHASVAKQLLDITEAAPFLRSKWLFEIADHLNAAAAAGAISDTALLYTSLTINTEACAASRKLMVYSAAKTYMHGAKRNLGLIAGRDLAGQTSWSFDHVQMFRLNNESIALHLLMDEPEEAATALAMGMSQARSVAEKARLHYTMINAYYSKNRPLEALKIGREALAMLGHPLPSEPAEITSLVDRLTEKHNLMDLERIERLSEIGLATSEDAIVLGDVMGAFMSILYLVEMSSLPAMCAMAWDIAITAGITGALATPMAMRAVMLAAGGQFSVAYALGQQVRNLVMKHKLLAAEAQVHVMVAAHVMPWTRPIRDTYEPIQASIRAGLECGDYTYVGFAQMHRHYLQIVEGNTSLTTIVREIPEQLTFARSSKNLLAQGGLTVTLRACTKIMQNDRFNMAVADLGETMVEEEAAFNESIAGVAFTQTAYLNLYALHCYSNDRLAECLRVCEQVDPMAAHIAGQVLPVLAPFLQALCILRLRMDEFQMARVEAILARIKPWAESALANFGAMYALVQAEVLRVSKADQASVINKYSEALSLATPLNCLWVIAFIHEAAARYWNNETCVFANEYRESHLKHAIVAYRTWGANTKAEAIRARGHRDVYPATPELSYTTPSFAASTPQDVERERGQGLNLSDTHSHTRGTATTGGSITDEMDALFLLKASQAISSELRPDRLFDIALPIIMESAGAEHACILSIDAEGKVRLEAKCSEALERDSVATELPPFMEIAVGDEVTTSSLLLPLVNIIATTVEPRIVNDALKDLKFWHDPYVKAHKPRSLMCAPMLNRGVLTKILYLENNQYPGTFNRRRMTFAKVLLSQTSISFENARMYAHIDATARAMAANKAEMAAQLAAANTAKEAAIMAVQAKSQAIANTVHELRTPMIAVIGLANELLAGKLDAEQRENVEIIRNSGDSLVELIKSMLDMSKMEASKFTLEMSSGDIRECIRDCCLTLKVKAGEKKLELRSEIDVSVPNIVVADMLRIRQIVINLLGNAIKFTDHGYIRVAFYATPLPGPVKLDESTVWSTPVPADAPWFEIHGLVQDTGAGISQEGVEKLFKPFEQVDKNATRRQLGTGLGLVISHNICNLMGGRMWVESTERRGSTFHFTISCPSVTAMATPSPVSDPLILSAAPLRLLIVDDHLINLKVVTKMLTRLGYSAQVAQSGMEALTIVKTAAEPFDAVFMDLHMPNGIDGYEATRRLRAEVELPHQPRIIALTADAMTEGKEKLLEAGFDDHLAKPVKLAELIAALRSVDPMRKFRLETGSSNLSNHSAHSAHSNDGLAASMPSSGVPLAGRRGDSGNLGQGGHAKQPSPAL